MHSQVGWSSRSLASLPSNVRVVQGCQDGAECIVGAVRQASVAFLWCMTVRGEQHCIVTYLSGEMSVSTTMARGAHIVLVALMSGAWLTLHRPMDSTVACINPHHDFHSGVAVIDTGTTGMPCLVHSMSVPVLAAVPAIAPAGASASQGDHIYMRLKLK